MHGHMNVKKSVELTNMHWTFVIVNLLNKLHKYTPIWGTYKSYALFRVFMSSWFMCSFIADINHCCKAMIV